jgi:hypothetical protein
MKPPSEAMTPGPSPGSRPVTSNSCPPSTTEGRRFFVAKACVAELHELGRPDRQAHLMEMSEVAAAIFDAFSPRKTQLRSARQQCSSPALVADASARQRRPTSRSDLGRPGLPTRPMDRRNATREHGPPRPATPPPQGARRPKRRDRARLHLRPRRGLLRVDIHESRHQYREECL